MGERLKNGRPPSLNLWALDYEKAILYFQVGTERLPVPAPSCGIPLPPDAKIDDPLKFMTSFSCKSRFVGFEVTDLIASLPDAILEPFRKHMVDQDLPWEGALKRKENPCAEDNCQSDAEDAVKSGGSSSSSPQQKVQPTAAAAAPPSRISRQDSFKSSIFKNLKGSGKAAGPTVSAADA
eukprot:6488980-Amphidinium_carterae.1